MDEHNEDIPQLYQDGFNHGYTIAKVEPEFAETLAKNITSNGDYEQGFEAGRDELLKEKELEQLEELGKLRDKEKGHDLDKV